MSYRTLSYVALGLSIIFLPYWLYLPLLLGSLIIFPFFWEGILFALFIEALYGREMQLLSLESSVALSVLIILLVLLPLRERIRIHV